MVVPVPEIQERIADVVDVITEERVLEHIVEPIVGVLMLLIRETQLVLEELIHEHIVEQNVE